ncbi:conserved hypothetical protein [Agrobacterium fabacearum S56]|uniref:hypothetical protein n=1 Tax=Agrobacterium tumefaciens TaxID=358 RepID=UPI0009C61994|nr:hypothetical protein [Agrobacterium tumefaciens]CUW97581.1 conserved hypothetical protein [Agrobacterium fabacearum S56]
MDGIHVTEFTFPDKKHCPAGFIQKRQGYDVLSASNERISVETITRSTHVDFNLNTFHHVDRVIVVRVNVDDDKGISVEELLNEPVGDARQLMRGQGGKLVYPIKRGTREERTVESLEIAGKASYSDFEIVKYENGAIRIFRHGEPQQVVFKETLRSVAAEIGVDLFNSKGGLKNTQQLGADVIRTLNATSDS